MGKRLSRNLEWDLPDLMQTSTLENFCHGSRCFSLLPVQGVKKNSLNIYVYTVHI